MTIEVHWRPGGPACTRLRGGTGRGVAWTLGYPLVWLGLALWRPATTWHLGPVLVAAALPWSVLADLATVRHSDGATSAALLLSGGTALVAVVLGVLLAARRGGSDATTP